MERKKIILADKCLIVFVIVILLLCESCGLKEIAGIDDVKVKTDTRVILPLAYGAINLQTLIDYVNRNNLIFSPDSDGYFSFEPTIKYYEFPDTFAFQGSMLDVLSQLELRIETENRLPIGIKLTLDFADYASRKVYGPEIVCNILEPADIDHNGEVAKSSHHIETIILTKQLIVEYRNANAIFVKFNFFLPDIDDQKIYVNQKNSLSLNIGVVVQAKSNEN